MPYLLDTHTFLWFIADDNALSEDAKAAIEKSTEPIFLSMASIWEIAIKVSLGRLTVETPFDTFINEQLARNAFHLLSITPSHAKVVSTMTFHHRDPFDRLIIAQATVEKLTIIGKDAVFDDYGVDRHW